MCRTIIHKVFNTLLSVHIEEHAKLLNSSLYFNWLCLGVRLICYWTRASCDRGRLYDSEIEFLSKAYTNPNTNPKTLTEGILTLNDRHGAFASFCAPVFCDFIWNYFLSDSETFGLLDTSFLKWVSTVLA